LNPDKSIQTPGTFAAIICAAGSSSRMGGVKKEYCPIPGTSATVLGRSVLAFAANPCITRIAITVPENGEESARQALPVELRDDPRLLFVAGGSTRGASVHNALAALSACSADYVLIHDGCRPWVSVGLIERIIDAVQQCHAVIPLLPLVDTPKEINLPFDSGSVPFVTRHLRRSTTGLAQTPQAFAYGRLLSAYEKAAVSGVSGYTDDAEVWGRYCGPVAVIPGEIENKKITFPGDLEAEDAHAETQSRRDRRDGGF